VIRRGGPKQRQLEPTDELVTKARGALKSSVVAMSRFDDDGEVTDCGMGMLGC
jgi:hypothetical protein